MSVKQSERLFCMKKIFLAFAAFFIAHSAFSKAVSVSVTPSVIFSKSEVKEIIYTESVSEKLSELEWNEGAAVKAGLFSSVNFKNINLNLNFASAIPSECGTMYDSDWNLSGLKTTYSIHEQNVKNDISGGLEFLYNFNVFNGILKFSPGVSVNYSYKAFEGRNGYGWYGGWQYSKTGKDEAWNSSNARKAKKVAGIDYTKHDVSCFLSLYSGVKINALYFQAGFGVSPFCFYDVKDHHYGATGNGFDNEYIFYSNFKRIKIDFSSTYKFSKYFALNVEGMFEKQFLDYGNLYTNYYTEKLTKSNQKSGIEFYDFCVKIGFSFFVL